MKKATRAVLPFVCLLAAACGDDKNGDDDDGDDDGGVERRLVLFHTNDEHSHLFGFAPEIDDFPLPTTPGDGTIVGSIARRAELLDQERAALDEEGIDSLTVSAGDQTQGALPQIRFAETSPDFTLMAQLGYDIMCPGNHEFDLGPEAFAFAIEAAEDMPPLVSTNIAFSEDEADDTLEALYGEGLSAAPITPYQILETPSGIRVGFVGIMGVNASDVAPNKVPVDFSADLEAVYASIQPAVDALREQDVDLVVALSHSGVDLNTPANGEDFNIAQNVEGIDIIVSGHTHTRVDEAIIAEGPDGHDVPIVQTGAYGRFLGRVELVLPADGGRPSLATSELISIDDTIVPSDDSITSQLDALIADLESTVLPAQISRIEGAEVTDDPKVLGDLYYRDMGSTTFDIIGLRSRTETNMLNLSNDAKLAAAEEFFGPTDIAIEASGTVRDDILVGETGVLSYADLFRVFPLGENPFDGGSIGYPLVRFKIYLWAVRAALEVGVSIGYVDDSFYLSASGLFVEYDTNLDPLDTSNFNDVFDESKGRITRIVLDVDKSGTLDETDIAIFDRARPGDEAWNSTAGGINDFYSVVTTLYIGSFADDNGIPLYDDMEQPVALVDTILTRDDGSDVKDYEAFIGYILTLAAENKGTLPTIYDENTVEGEIPRHMLCEGPLCVK
jgi:2',3'-cyclic-nucleotide 2'-phosphodiesterase (5'-nucleotidase family)